MAFDKRKEYFPRARHQEKDASAEIGGAAVARGLGQPVEPIWLICDQRHNRVRKDTHRNAGFGNRLYGPEPQFRARRARFQ